MGVVLDKIQFVLVIITFTEIMWPYLQLNSDTTQESNILNQSSLITFQKKNILMHLMALECISVCVSHLLYKAFSVGLH